MLVLVDPCSQNTFLQLPLLLTIDSGLLSVKGFDLHQGQVKMAKDFVSWKIAASFSSGLIASQIVWRSSIRKLSVLAVGQWELVRDLNTVRCGHFVCGKVRHLIILWKKNNDNQYQQQHLKVFVHVSRTWMWKSWMICQQHLRPKHVCSHLLVWY